MIASDPPKCPTCDRDMLVLGCRVTELPLHWCSICGTILPCEDSGPVVPDLVRRCRDYEATQIGGTDGTFWEGMGIAEAINKPEDR
jgi:hypothetical protein